MFIERSYARISNQGFVLANAKDGNDVWFGCARGTQFSRKHRFLDPDNSTEFWNYSFHEIGKYDVPAMIDTALTKSNRTSLHYVGHSQGCCVFFIMLSFRPEYNKKVVSMHAMAPSLFINGTDIVPVPITDNADTIKVSSTIDVIRYTIFVPFLGDCRWT